MDNEALKLYESLKRPMFDILFYLQKIKQVKEIFMLPLITARYVFLCFTATKIGSSVEIFGRKILYGEDLFNAVSF